jgi:hypothetical protein
MVRLRKVQMLSHQLHLLQNKECCLFLLDTFSLAIPLMLLSLLYSTIFHSTATIDMHRQYSLVLYLFLVLIIAWMCEPGPSGHVSDSLLEMRRLFQYF